MSDGIDTEEWEVLRALATSIGAQDDSKLCVVFDHADSTWLSVRGNGWTSDLMDAWLMPEDVALDEAGRIRYTTAMPLTRALSMWTKTMRTIKGTVGEYIKHQDS